MSAHAADGLERRRDGPRPTRRWILLCLAAVSAAWAVVLTRPRGGPSLFSAEAWARIGGFLERLAGVGLGTDPAFLRAEVWASVGEQAVTTLALSVCAAAMAGTVALSTVHLAARPRAGALPRTGALRHGVGWALRSGYVFVRSIPEIVWGLLMVLILAPGPVAAALALGIHNAGILGRLLTDLVEDLDPAVDQALETTGAGRAQRYLYGALPRILPQCLTFGLYRWEVIIRTTVVVEAVTGTGLGQTLRLALSARAFTTVTVVLITYLVLVLLVDVVAGHLRRMAR